MLKIGVNLSMMFLMIELLVINEKIKVIDFH